MQRMSIESVGDHTTGMRKFDVDEVICACSIFLFSRGQKMLSRGHSGDPGEIGWDLIERLMQVEGIEKIYLHPYELTIDIGNAFRYQDLEIEIIRALEDVLNQVDRYAIIRNQREWPTSYRNMDEWGMDEETVYPDRPVQASTSDVFIRTPERLSLSMPPRPQNAHPEYETPSDPELYVHPKTRIQDRMRKFDPVRDADLIGDSV